MEKNKVAYGLMHDQEKGILSADIKNMKSEQRTSQGKTLESLPIIKA